MLYININGEKIPVPKEVEAEGPAAVQGFIDGQVARLAVEKAEAPPPKRRSRSEGAE